MTKTEIDKLRAVAPSLWLPFRIAELTGLRIGDVLKIRPGDVRKGGFVYTAQKTGKRGFAALPDELIVALLRSSRLSRWCFPSPKDASKHLTRQAAWARVKRACEKAGVDPRGVSPHSFRKVFAVDLLGRSSLSEVQKALQHDRSTTTELYALSDWATGDNALVPLTRGDMLLIVGQILSILGYGVDGKPKP